MKKWLSATRKGLLNADTNTLAASTTALVEQVIDHICGTLQATSTVAWTRTLVEGLRKVVARGVDIFQDLHFQEANYFIYGMDPSQTKFDHSWMEDLTGEDEASLPGRQLDAVIFPVVSKAGTVSVFPDAVDEGPLTQSRIIRNASFARPRSCSSRLTWVCHLKLV